MKVAGYNPIWSLWEKGGPFIGRDKAVGRVTVDDEWWLEDAHRDLGIYPRRKRPVRWFQRADHNISGRETEIPNIESIEIDRSIDSDAATCTIVVKNIKMRYDWAEQDNDDPMVLGKPGFYGPTHGQSEKSRARWDGQRQNIWRHVLIPNALIRTYQGYGGNAYTQNTDPIDGSIGAAQIESWVDAGHLVRTGTWLVDKVQIGTDGKITLECRDMAKLLIEQLLYPPVIPRGIYPLRYCRWKWKNEQRSRTIPGTPGAEPGERNALFVDSAVDRWYPTGATGSQIGSGGYVLHGHKGADSIDGNAETFALSVGNSGPDRPFTTDWWEYACGEEINAVYMHPWGGNYTMYVSIMENGAWVDGGHGLIPYDAGPLYGTQSYVIDTGADIPYVAAFGTPWETAQEYLLPRMYRAERVRISFRNHTLSPWGPWYYRCGIRELRLLVSEAGAGSGTPETTHEWTEEVRYDGNYKDYADIVKDLLLWGGFFAKEDVPAGGRPAVLGGIESTGAYADECLPADLFDKRPIIDPITELKETVGYIFYVDEDGGAHWESPNWWSRGNFNENGARIDFIPEIDERTQLTQYGVEFSDDAVVSNITIASSDPLNRLDDTVVTRFRPNTARLLRGIKKPALWINGYFTNRREQETMAELIAMHVMFRQRTASITCWANPCIGPDDQVRVFERTTSETYVHYVRGVRTSWNADTGAYTMTLTTHWLGDSKRWAVGKGITPNDPAEDD